MIKPKQIKEIRESLALSQEELAKILGVTKNTVWRYENGQVEPKLDVLDKLTQLHVSILDPGQRQALLSLRGTVGGIAGLTAVSAMAAACGSGCIAGGVGVTGVVSSIKTPAGKSLYTFLDAIFSNLLSTKQEKNVTCSDQENNKKQ